MANIIGQGEIPQMPGGAQPKVDISASVPVYCECGGKTFLPAIKMRKLSKLAYGGDQDMMIPFEVYLCGDCGAEQELFKPVQLRALESKDKMESKPKIELDTNG
jgi:hypothetical protein